jgi:hypothetical protein
MRTSPPLLVADVIAAADLAIGDLHGPGDGTWPTVVTVTVNGASVIVDLVDGSGVRQLTYDRRDAVSVRRPTRKETS